MAASGGHRHVPLAVWVLLVPGLLSFGFAAIFVRFAGDAPALTMAAARTAVVALVAGGAALLRDRAALARQSRADRLWIAAAGVLFGLHFGAWIVAVQKTTVATVSVLVTMSPLFLVVLGALFLRERPTGRTLVAVGAGVAGAVCIGLAQRGAADPAPDPALGAVLALTAALLVAGYMLIGRAVRQRTTALAFFGPLNVSAAVTLLLVVLLADAPLTLRTETWGWVLALGIGPGLLGHGTLVVALRYLPASTVGVLSLAEPVLATLLALVLLGETPAPLALAGMALVLGSIAVVVVRRPDTGRPVHPGQASRAASRQASAGRSEKRLRPRA